MYHLSSLGNSWLRGCGNARYESIFVVWKQAPLKSIFSGWSDCL